MRKLTKNKKGFTLVEMVLVIGIIVILAAVVLIGISSYLSQAKTVASNFSQEQQSFSDKNKQINENFIDLGY